MKQVKGAVLGGFNSLPGNTNEITMKVLIELFREVSKIIIFTLAWGAPLLFAWDTNNPNYLWLLLASLFFICVTFGHYRELSKFENLGSIWEMLNNKDDNDEKEASV